MTDDSDEEQGNQEVLEKETSSLLAMYVGKLAEYKELLNVTPSTINKNVLKTKTHEKEKMVKKLGDLTVDEREIEDLMKNCSLGEWGVGRTKAIFQYDNKQYDKERDQLEKDALMEMRSGGISDVSEFTGEIYNMSHILEQRLEDEVADRINSEVNDLSEVVEDGEEDDN